MLERTHLDSAGDAVGTGELSTLDVDLVFRSVGYRGLPMLGLPFDERSGVIRNLEGRVVRDGVPVPGVYVAGWIKRGPTGVIGTNKHDARETVAALLADAPTLPKAPVRDSDALLAELAARGVRPVTWAGWRAIEVAEAQLGQQQGRERARISDRQALLAAASSQR
jgi:ferredoxin--NADP+ reductase